MKYTVGDRIKYFRLCRGMSQEKLALKAGLNPAFLGHLERNMKSPTLTTLAKIVKALEISYGEFFDEEVDVNDTESRVFYMDIIQRSMENMSEDKLKIMADIVLKMVEFAE
ncbi:MAG: helix-turn-helix domain-containing protein [Ruminococcus sp.]|nr:helix-turn-helix domain-containing protein [Ruminococcus sp.]MDE6848572.1 helix-turn-helix domain-containing protein [Ruminococcus sp.]